MMAEFILITGHPHIFMAIAEACPADIPSPRRSCFCYEWPVVGVDGESCIHRELIQRLRNRAC
jgi:hypothetical protein